ncbi:hypothetical protein H6F32_10775 [Anabaena sp. FACHB-1237]|uniref:hypothetical protein n=1 Tax=Anabaena sp. FACHB-1237 TaxID=2692769 RepID=UPI001680C9C8|nr:hypothetical protein [Anabaena sp. FACHB-1237]MBD2138061.1 hypothetical protein [Anabaena sp. FACHB-1237]
METIQNKELRLLSEILKERLVAEIPDSQKFDVKCGIKNDELVILTTHPTHVTVNTKQVFSVLEQALQWQFHYQTERVLFFIRSMANKRPYDKYIAYFRHQHTKNIAEIQLLDEPLPEDQELVRKYQSAAQPEIVPPSDLNNNLILDSQRPISDSSSASSETPLFVNAFADNIEDDGGEAENNDILYTPDAEYEHESIDNSVEKDKFDPFAKIPNKRRKQRLALSFPPLPVIFGSLLVVAIISTGGMFVLYRGCAISECQELQNAQQLKNDYLQKIKSVKSEKDLPAIQQKLATSITQLKMIPGWSPKYAQSQELITSFTKKLAKITQAATALGTASAAEKTSTTPVKSLDELRNRQKQWQQAITRLQAIQPNNEIYQLVMKKLGRYQNRLMSVNQQIVREEIWLSKLRNAQKVAEAAITLQTTAKSAPEWQRVESGLQGAISQLKTIPVDSLSHQETQKLLNEYQPKWIFIRDRAKKEKNAATAYQVAIKTANLAKGLGTQNEYKAAVNAWQQAIYNARKVTEGSFYHEQAAILIQSYSSSLKDAKQQLEMSVDNLTKTKTELNTTCTSSIKICTFAVNNQGINVRLTAEYDQKLQANNQEMENHFRSLQQALSVISKNANLPVVLTNSKGEEKYMKKPE